MSAKFTYVDQSGFKPSCVKIKLKGQFLFINNGRQPRSVMTERGAPLSFSVQLPRRTSTYARKFSKAGTYVITDKTTHKSMTLYVG